MLLEQISSHFSSGVVITEATDVKHDPYISYASNIMKEPCFVIGIGSSAGGFYPLSEILSGLPKNFDAAVIVVQHLPAGAVSRLDAILAKTSEMKVVAVETIEYLEAGYIYVMAEGQAMHVKDRFIQLTPRDSQQRINRTIDELFMTMADDIGEKAIGVILSGAGYDGVEGAKAIESHGGTIIVQDPNTAAFPLMPATLIANNHPDHILEPDDIATKIIEKVQRSSDC